MSVAQLRLLGLRVRVGFLDFFFRSCHFSLFLRCHSPLLCRSHAVLILPSSSPYGLLDPGQPSADGVAAKKLHVSQQNLMKAWAASHRSTNDDWVVWMRGFSIELLKESPSSALRACSALAQKHPPLAKELFNAAFVSVIHAHIFLFFYFCHCAARMTQQHVLT